MVSKKRNRKDRPIVIINQANKASIFGAYIQGDGSRKYFYSIRLIEIYGRQVPENYYLYADCTFYVSLSQFSYKNNCYFSGNPTFTGSKIVIGDLYFFITFGDFTHFS